MWAKSIFVTEKVFGKESITETNSYFWELEELLYKMKGGWVEDYVEIFF